MNQQQQQQAAAAAAAAAGPTRTSGTRTPTPEQQAYLQERAKKQHILNEQLNQHVQSYPIQLDFPATVSSTTVDVDDDVDGGNTNATDTSGTKKPSPVLRTSSDFINYRLLETTGLDFISGLAGGGNESDATETETETTNTRGGKITSSSSLAETTQSLNEFIKDLQNTNCYNSIQVILENNKNNPSNTSSSSSSSHLQKLNIVLNEKNWYKLYIGGGIKQSHDSLSSSTTTSGIGGALPKLQFETSASLINLTGFTDMTKCSYTIDQTSTPTLSLLHTRPLFSLFDDNTTSTSTGTDTDTNTNTTSGMIGDTILNMNNGSKYGITFKANIDTLDYEHTRSSKDHIQSIGICVANSTTGSESINPSTLRGDNDQPYVGIDWSLSHRDVLPRRHKSLPYLCDASPDIIACGGPSYKHSLIGEYRLNGYYTDSKYNPTIGLDSYGGVEIAGPPGDVGFLKCWSGGSIHLPLGSSSTRPSNVNGSGEDDDSDMESVGLLEGFVPRGLAFHSSYNCGMIKSLSYGGLCSTNGNMTNIIDRFYVGGPHQLRGFLPAGIGPRADTGGASSPGGDSVGGDIYYSTTTMLSMPFPGNNLISKQGVRLFGFANAGTLTGLDSAVNPNSFIKSTRVAVGGGVSVGTPMGRLEATYAVPLRYGPRDARKAVQIGMGFTFG